MRGRRERQAEMLLGVTADALVPADHPIRRVRSIVDAVLVAMNDQFAALYKENGRPSVPPEHLLKACLLMGLYSIRSERQLCEQLRYNVLFKWFLDLNISEVPFDPTTFSKNRERLMNTDVASAFLAQVVNEAIRRKLISSDHFTVDGTLIEARASVHAPKMSRQPTVRAVARTSPWTSMASAGATTHMSPGPIAKRGWPAKDAGSQRNSRTRGTS